MGWGRERGRMTGWMEDRFVARKEGREGEKVRKGEHVEKPRSWRLQGLFGEQKVPQLAGLELGFKPQAILLFPLSPSAFHRDPGFRAITF